MDILKPGRYINKEWNSIHREWTPETVKVALCFPDIYEIGMSHLGMRILYGALNSRRDVLCERIFAPWSDMEKKMRSEGSVLSSLENKRQLNDFDIVGFSLQYEMSFVDVLNMLDLGEVPIRSSERNDADPLVIAGGPCAFNPNPMTEFIDAFLIGEGEEAFLEIVKIVKDFPSKDKLLKELSKIDGIYVPRITQEDSSSTVKKRIVKDMDNSYFPTEPIVPYIQIVHDRIGIEVMRGCPHKCKFCQACKVFYPLRMRSVERILEIAEESIKNTGYEEISLLSLSTGDYPHIEELVGKLERRFRSTGVKISLPSLRVRELDDRSIGGSLKKAGLTFAPEAGSERLRNALGKRMDNDDIINKSKLAFKAGWRKVKLYFMIGLPGETHEDLDSIIELASKIKNVNLSISSFIPKPHSEFERECMDDLDALKEKRASLRSARNIKMDFHDPEMSRVEAIISRGDRKIGDLIYRIWQKGARLQAWTEHFDYGLWEESLGESGLNARSYLKNREKEEFLPWGFIEA